MVGWGSMLVQQGQRQAPVLVGSKDSVAEWELASESMVRQRADPLEQVLSEPQRQPRRMVVLLAKVHPARDTLQDLSPALLPPLLRHRPQPG